MPEALPRKCCVPDAVDNLLGLKVSADTLPGQHTSTWPRSMVTATVCLLACGSVPGEPGVACLDFGLRVPGRSFHGARAIHKHPEPRAPQPWFPPAPRFRAHTASQLSTQPWSVTPAVPSLSLQWAIASLPRAQRLLARGA